MSDGLIDIKGLFGLELETQEQKQAALINNNLGLFQNGWAGTLAEARANSQMNMRGHLNRAGQSINPDFDMRTNDQQYREAINNIDPEAEDAQDQYIDATRRLMPSKLPALMQGIRERTIEDEDRQYRYDANQRAEAADVRAQAVEGRSAARHDTIMATEEAQLANAELATEVAEYNFAEIKNDDARLETGMQFVIESGYAAKQGLTEAGIAALSKEGKAGIIQAAVTYNEGLDSTLNTQVLAMYPDNGLITEEFLEGLSVAQKQTLAQSAISGAEPNWQQGVRGETLINMNDPKGEDGVIYLKTSPVVGDADSLTNADLENLVESMQNENQRDFDFLAGSNGTPADFKAMYRRIEANLKRAGDVRPTPDMVLSEMRTEAQERLIETSNADIEAADRSYAEIQALVQARTGS